MKSILGSIIKFRDLERDVYFVFADDLNLLCIKRDGYLYCICGEGHYGLGYPIARKDNPNVFVAVIKKLEVELFGEYSRATKSQ